MSQPPSGVWDSQTPVKADGQRHTARHLPQKTQPLTVAHCQPLLERHRKHDAIAMLEPNNLHFFCLPAASENTPITGTSSSGTLRIVAVSCFRVGWFERDENKGSCTSMRGGAPMARRLIRCLMSMSIITSIVSVLVLPANAAESMALRAWEA